MWHSWALVFMFHPSVISYYCPLKNSSTKRTLTSVDWQLTHLHSQTQKVFERQHFLLKVIKQNKYGKNVCYNWVRTNTIVCSETGNIWNHCRSASNTHHSLNVCGPNNSFCFTTQILPLSFLYIHTAFNSLSLSKAREHRALDMDYSCALQILWTLSWIWP